MAPNPYKILVVDDETLARRLLIHWLTKCEMPNVVLEAANGEQAIEVAQNEAPNLIISDWNMPDFSGLELIGKLKSSDETHKIPIIITSGVMLDDVHLEQALNLGAVDYLRKPFSRVELLARVGSSLRLWQAHHQQLELQKELYQNQLNSRAEILILKNAQLRRYNHLVNSLLMQIAEIEKLNSNAAISKTLNGIKQDIVLFLNEASEELVGLDVDMRYPKFKQAFYAEFPNLTEAEKRLSDYVLLAIPSRRIAELLNLTNSSLKIARKRLRKKLGLDPTQDLEQYLLQFTE